MAAVELRSLVAHDQPTTITKNSIINSTKQISIAQA